MGFIIMKARWEIIEDLNMEIGKGKFSNISKKTNKEFFNMGTKINNNIRNKFNDWINNKISNNEFSIEIKKLKEVS